MQIDSVQSFVEPTVHGRKQFARLPRLALIAPEPRQRVYRLQLRTFGRLCHGNIKRHSQACLRPVDLAGCLEDPRADRMNSRQAPTIPDLRRGGNRKIRLLQAFLVLAGRKIGFRQQAKHQAQVASHTEPTKDREALLKGPHAAIDIIGLTDSPAQVGHSRGAGLR